MPARRVALFLISMAGPGLLVLVLGIRTIAQQTELHAKRLEDERRLLKSEFERALHNRLEAARRQSGHASVSLVGTLQDDHLVLPWERTADDAIDARFDAALAAAEREEFGDRLDRADAAIRTALALARVARHSSRAKLVHARIMAKTGRQEDAARLYLSLLRESPQPLDDHAVPYALYGAERLLQIRGSTPEIRGEVRHALDRAVNSPHPLSPVAWYLARSVAATAGDATATGGSTDHVKAIAARLADAEQALSLQRDLAPILALWRADPTAWAPFGSPLWLIGLSERAERRHVIAVRADSVVDAIHADAPRLGGHTLTTRAESGEWLGGQFPGLKISVAAQPASGIDGLWLQRAFYFSALAIVSGITMFGGYLLWRDMNRELKLAALRSQFVASVSHELKTPLTAIRMFAETLRLGRADAVTRDEYLDTIVNESERLTRLLNNVLDFSKIEQGRRAYRLQPQSLPEIVRVAARAMAYPLEQHGFTLRLDIDKSVPPVKVDADALEQAILNLLANAMKYSGNGRIIDLRLTHDGIQAIIAIRDAGIGIPLHEQTRIFEKFYRVPTPENQRIPGTGLGLALVDHIVKAHAGSVRVESTPGAGSTFSILLPLRGVSS